MILGWTAGTQALGGWAWAGDGLVAPPPGVEAPRAVLLERAGTGVLWLEPEAAVLSFSGRLLAPAHTMGGYATIHHVLAAVGTIVGPAGALRGTVRIVKYADDFIALLVDQDWD